MNKEPTAVLDEVNHDVLVELDATLGRASEPGEFWERVLSTQWSVLDQFTFDGRRYVLLRREDGDKDAFAFRSRSEIAALSCMGAGCSNKVISGSLGVSQRMVAKHLKSARLKLGGSAPLALSQLAFPVPPNLKVFLHQEKYSNCGLTIPKLA